MNKMMTKMRKKSLKAFFINCILSICCFSLLLIQNNVKGVTKKDDVSNKDIQMDFARESYINSIISRNSPMEITFNTKLRNLTNFSLFGGLSSSLYSSDELDKLNHPINILKIMSNSTEDKNTNPSSWDLTLMIGWLTHRPKWNSGFYIEVSNYLNSIQHTNVSNEKNNNNAKKKTSMQSMILKLNYVISTNNTTENGVILDLGTGFGVFFSEAELQNQFLLFNKKFNNGFFNEYYVSSGYRMFFFQNMLSLDLAIDLKAIWESHMQLFKDKKKEKNSIEIKPDTFEIKPNVSFNWEMMNKNDFIISLSGKFAMSLQKFISVHIESKNNKIKDVTNAWGIRSIQETLSVSLNYNSLIDLDAGISLDHMFDYKRNSFKPHLALRILF
ncbi:MAG: hypothetical protein ISN64_02020 [Rickettsia sp.]|nr:hypothetical protein [Rickettsia sp.]